MINRNANIQNYFYYCENLTLNLARKVQGAVPNPPIFCQNFSSFQRSSFGISDSIASGIHLQFSELGLKDLRIRGWFSFFLVPTLQLWNFRLDCYGYLSSTTWRAKYKTSIKFHFFLLFHCLLLFLEKGKMIFKLILYIVQ